MWQRNSGPTADYTAKCHGNECRAILHKHGNQDEMVSLKLFIRVSSLFETPQNPASSSRNCFIASARTSGSAGPPINGKMVGRRGLPAAGPTLRVRQTRELASCERFPPAAFLRQPLAIHRLLAES